MHFAEGKTRAETAGFHEISDVSPDSKSAPALFSLFSYNNPLDSSESEGLQIVLGGKDGAKKYCRDPASSEEGLKDEQGIQCCH